MEVEAVENVLFSDESTPEQRLEAFYAWWKRESDHLNWGQGDCSTVDCLMCEVLNTEDIALQAQQFRLFLTVVVRRDVNNERLAKLAQQSQACSRMPAFKLVE